ncbi:sugar porter family MFS transporter [Colletotrichum paranaense]|uniref:Sugar porter family MFS transporter n=2 Tax=Colletotrichum acutatum species complex TaxID=2707335 RepID=A0AAI9XLM9_9PEZI|nr:sugar porter family MFS transporter [Colletotrichum paranaense]KAK1453494.1 sugar porter family MFS transporter [Colletotrichum melonis]KAK1537943.1 sugar porter family MFS transporter [Colletotrichum paranaense]
MSTTLDSKSDPAKVEAYGDIDHVADLDEKALPSSYKADAIEAEQAEHNMGVLEAVKAYPMASLWAFIMSTTIIMESYCVFLMGAFVAMDEFKDAYGVDTDEGKAIEASWQSALQMGGPLGAIIGVCIAGPITSRIGYRWATISGLMLLNAFIFVFYFANSLAVMFVSQLLEGIPWGIFIANAPAYCSEIVPMRLRAPATQMLQMFWAIGAIIVGGVCYVYESKRDPSAYRVPIALQWMFPTPLAILLFLAPESPWWLVRKGRLEEAAVSVRRLGRSSAVANIEESVAMMRRTIELEKDVKDPSYIELFKGTDRYRTLIVCGVYAAQNLTGNLIANQAVYFFRQAGIGSQLAFALGLITSALQTVFVMLSWILTTYLGRRTIYVWGSLINVIFLIALGIAGSVGKSTAASLAMASLGLIVSVGFTLGPAPASWVIIAETSSIRLRPLTTGIGRAAYYVVNIPCIFLATYMLNPTGVNLGGKCGYVWGATGFVCFVLAFFFVPEMKGRSFREIDIMFKRKIPARQWKKTVIDINDDE